MDAPRLCSGYWSPRESACVSLRKRSFVDNEIRFKKKGESVGVFVDEPRGKVGREKGFVVLP